MDATPGNLIQVNDIYTEELAFLVKIFTKVKLLKDPKSLATLD